MPAESVRAKIGHTDLIIETGKLAKQADGAVVVQYGESVVIVTAVAAAKAPEEPDFFPLTVDYFEKAAAVGRFPGGYFRREGKPSEKEILTARLTDRPIRPLFPEGFFNEVQIISTLLSADGQNDPDILSIVGASTALTVSDIPWNGPIGAVRVAEINGEFVVNPTNEQRPESGLDLVYVGTEHEMLMIEGSAQEISNERFLEAIQFAHERSREVIALQKALQKKAGKTKRQVELKLVKPEILQAATTLAGEDLVNAVYTPGKVERGAKVDAIKQAVFAKLSEQFPQATPFDLSQAFEYLQAKTVRETILKKGKRADGRQANQLRQLSSEIGILPRPHGSALFTRGETQALVLVTLGALNEAQELESLTGGETEKRFILHYNFPPFSVGETGRVGIPKRREIGHGALAERSLLQVIPSEEEFPYAIRLVSEILESNGSTSMASICGGSLALMHAGVPIRKPVAGISVGLVKEGDQVVTLTDIIGHEDHFGDMDCKIAGTRDGITGFQLDLKLPGLSFDIFKNALKQAHEARQLILDNMEKAIAAPSTELSKYAPRIDTVRIDPEKIGLVIGPQGKNIKAIVAETGCEINIEDDGSIFIYSNNPEGMARAREIIEGMTGDIEVGKTYHGTVKSVKEFGAFVECLPGKEGLVHISELANFRVNRVEDVAKLGDKIWVKVIGVDEKGRVKLSRKAAMAERDQQVAATSGAPAAETKAPATAGK